MVVSRARVIRRRVGLSVVAVLLASVVGFLVWASLPMQAESAPLDEVRSDPELTITESADGIILAPTGAARQVGLVFIAGARVDPAAYAWKLSGLADAGVTVVIVRPVLNFAILDWRPITDFTSRAPGVTDWYVGGHSLGGVRACQYLADDAAADAPELSGLILFGSYCAADLSAISTPVLSLAGSEDGLSTPEKISEASSLLPPDADLVTIDGANHASFGDYGIQPGDGVATADDNAVRDDLTAGILSFIAG